MHGSSFIEFDAVGSKSCLNGSLYPNMLCTTQWNDAYSVLMSNFAVQSSGVHSELPDSLIEAPMSKAIARQILRDNWETVRDRIKVK